MSTLVLRFVVALISLGVVALTGPHDAFAQTRAAIVGTVVDPSDGALPGAEVTLSSPDLAGGPQTAVTTASGSYRFTDLPPGTYQVTANVAGFQTVSRQSLTLAFGATLTVDIRLTMAGVTDAVTVRGDVPAVDVTTAAAPGRVDEHVLQALPLMSDRRNAFEVMELTPGMKGHSAFGGARDANQLMLDGIPTTVPGGQGTNAVVFSTNWLQEVQVVAPGASAEYGEFTGAAVNFVTRSGANVFSGLFDYETTREGWDADNTGDLPANLRESFRSQKLLSRWTLNAQAGGPVVRERLFFFGGYEHFQDDVQPAGAPGVTHMRWPKYVGKLTWAASNAIKAEGLFSGSRSEVDYGGSATQTMEAAALQIQPNDMGNVRVTATPSSNTLLEVRYGWLRYEQDVRPRPPGTVDGPSPRTDTFTGIQSGNTSMYRLQIGERHDIGASLTQHVDNAVGSHALKAGIEIEAGDFYEKSGFPGGLSFSDFQGQPNTVTIWAGNNLNPETKRTTIYAQDSWRVGNRVTIEPGVRASFNRGSVPVRGTVFETNPVAARVGVAWDLFEDHRTVLRAHYGRFHEPLSTGEFNFLDTAGQTPRQTARVVGPGNYQITNPGTLPGNYAVADDLRHAYMDQFLIGIEREILPQTSVKLQYIRREWDDLFGMIDTGSRYAPVTQIEPGPDGVVGNSDDTGVFTLYNLTNPGQSFLVMSNPDGAWRRYNGVVTSVERRFADRWQVFASYTWSRAEGSVDNDQGQNISAGTFSDPNNAINREGLNSFDRPHEVLLRGSYDLPIAGGVLVAANYKYFSGATWTRQTTFRGLAQGNQVVNVEPRDSRRIDATNQIDLRIEKSFTIDTLRASIYVDMFNVNNQGVVDRNRIIRTSGPTLGLPQNFSQPRLYQAGARIRF